MAYGSGKTHSYFPALRVMESPVSYPELAPETRWILQKPTYSSETPLLYEEVSFTAAVPSLCYGTSHGKSQEAHELATRPEATPTPQWLRSDALGGQKV